MPNLYPELLDVVVELRDRAARWNEVADGYANGDNEYKVERERECRAQAHALNAAANGITHGVHVGANERAKQQHKSTDATEPVGQTPVPAASGEPAPIPAPAPVGSSQEPAFTSEPSPAEAGDRCNVELRTMFDRWRGEDAGKSEDDEEPEMWLPSQIEAACTAHAATEKFRADEAEVEISRLRELGYAHIDRAERIEADRDRFVAELERRNVAHVEPAILSKDRDEWKTRAMAAEADRDRLKTQLGSLAFENEALRSMPSAAEAWAAVEKAEADRDRLTQQIADLTDQLHSIQEQARK